MAVVMSVQFSVRKVLAHLAIGVAVGSGATAAFLAVKAGLSDPAKTYGDQFYQALVREMEAAQRRQAEEKRLRALGERMDIEESLKQYRAVVNVLPRTIEQVEQGAVLDRSTCINEQDRVSQLTELSEFYDRYDAQVAKGEKPGPSLRSAPDSVRENGIIQRYSAALGKACAQYKP